MVQKGRKTGYSIGMVKKEELLFKKLCELYFKRCEANGISKYTIDGYKMERGWKENKEEKSIEVKKETLKQEPIVKKETPEKIQAKTSKKKPVDDATKSIIENWYNNNEIVKVNVADIILTNKSHLRGCNLQVSNLDKVTSDRQRVAVKKIEGDKYTLVLGFKSYIISKVKGFETIDAVVTELTHDELAKELGLEK